MKIKLITLSIVLLSLVGCSKINKENYQAIESGMDYSEVEVLLGAPTECQEAIGLKQCKWGTEQRFIDIKFVADKVTYHSMKGLR